MATGATSHLKINNSIVVYQLKESTVELDLYLYCLFVFSKSQLVTSVRNHLAMRQPVLFSIYTWWATGPHKHSPQGVKLTK